MKDRLEVSPEMLTFVGDGGVADDDWPRDPLVLTFTRGEAGSIAVALAPLPEPGKRVLPEVPQAFMIARAACVRLVPDASLEAGEWHLPVPVEAIAFPLASGPSATRSASRRASN